jgi:hypothetical protein
MFQNATSRSKLDYLIYSDSVSSQQEKPKELNIPLTLRPMQFGIMDAWQFLSNHS